MPKKPHKELELKVEMDVGELRALQLSASAHAALASPPTFRKLRSVYFDTADCAIRKAGMSLRVRDIDGRWVQTVKAQTSVAGGISNPVEFECAVEGPVPNLAKVEDAALLGALKLAVNGSLMLPVFETVVERHSYRLKAENGAEAELAVDMGQVHSNHGLEPIGEAELELISGGPDDLIAFAESLFEGKRCRLANRNKATRGYVLIGTEEAVPLLPQSVCLPLLETGQSVEKTFVRLLDTIVAAILHNWAVTLKSTDPEGPHQLRVGLRILRSLLKAYRPALDGPSLRAIDHRARTLGRLVGRLRDMDVLVDEIYLPAVSSKKGRIEGLEQSLASHLGRYRDAVRRQVTSEMMQWRQASFQVELALLTQRKPWRQHVVKQDRKQPIDPVAIASLEKSLGRAQKLGGRLEGLSLDERHMLRKALKTVRYQGQIFASLFPSEDNATYFKRLKALQERFGYLNDVALSQRLGSLARLACCDSPEADKVFEHVQDHHQDKARKAWKKAQKRWRQFEEAKLFWR